MEDAALKLPMPIVMPPVGATLFWVIDIEADGPGYKHHIPCYTVRIGDSQAKYPRLVDETFVFKEPPEGGLWPMDPDTKRTFWDKQVELRAWIEAQAKPFHDELDRFERLWAHWVDIFPNWAYNNEMPNDNAGFDILRLSHLRNAYRRVPYPIRHFGVDSSEDEETGKIATNEAPKYHSIWDPSEPWWMLGMGETINIILKDHHGAAPTHHPADDTNHIYWQAVYWKAVSQHLALDEKFVDLCAEKIVNVLVRLKPCYVCHELPSEETPHVPCKGARDPGTGHFCMCLAHFCPKHVPVPLRTPCPCCTKRTEDALARQRAERTNALV